MPLGAAVHGFRTACDDHRAEHPAGGGDAVVLLHGIGRSLFGADVAQVDRDRVTGEIVGQVLGDGAGGAESQFHRVLLT